MNEAGVPRALTGWQRLHVLLAAQYLREIASTSPGDARARSAYEGLLEVLEPTRRVVREHREGRRGSAVQSSMWEQRTGRDRRIADRRTSDRPWPTAAERRSAQRRSGQDRRAARR
jgi:hypothetical protein